MGYECAKTTLARLDALKGLGNLQHFLSGVFAETVSCVMWVPIDVVKERLQVESLTRKPISRDAAALSTWLPNLQKFDPCSSFLLHAYTHIHSHSHSSSQLSNGTRYANACSCQSFVALRACGRCRVSWPPTPRPARAEALQHPDPTQPAAGHALRRHHRRACEDTQDARVARDLPGLRRNGACV
jgi:hypothetical protein